MAEDETDERRKQGSKSFHLGALYVAVYFRNSLDDQMRAKPKGPYPGQDIAVFINQQLAEEELADRFYIETHVIWDREKRSALGEAVTPAEFREMLARERGD